MSTFVSDESPRQGVPSRLEAVEQEQRHRRLLRAKRLARRAELTAARARLALARAI